MDALEDAINCYKVEMQARVRSYVSAKQFEDDADFEAIGDEKTVSRGGLEAIVNDQGRNDMLMIMKTCEPSHCGQN